MEVKARRNRPYRYHTLDQWKEIFKDWKESGLTKNAYCVQKKLSKTTFNKWEKKINSSPPHDTKDQKATLKDFFIPLPFIEKEKVLGKPSFSAQKIEVIFAGGDRLCLEGSFNLEVVSSWLTPLLTQ